ncbi:hypothetical protein JYT44_01395 [Caldithrix abyssi]|nr:hypothetical protein [Caldithrix abyssi]
MIIISKHTYAVYATEYTQFYVLLGFFRAAVNTGIPCLYVETAIGAIPFIRFEIGIGILRSIGTGNQDGHTNENGDDENEEIK